MAEEKKGRARAAARKINQSPALLTAAKMVRELLPGDSRFGDPLSTAGRGQSEIAGKRLAEVTAERPGVLREAGLSAPPGLAGRVRGPGARPGGREARDPLHRPRGFSDFALEAGDEGALDLLREVGEAIEPPVSAHGGEVVKRLGDGMMAVFPEPQAALEAVVEARERLTEVSADGYQPRIRAGMHLGQPRKLGGDYLGVDVNIAPRVAERPAATTAGLRPGPVGTGRRRGGRAQEATLLLGQGRAEGPGGLLGVA